MQVNNVHPTKLMADGQRSSESLEGQKYTLVKLVFPEWWKVIKALHNEESMKQ